MNTEITRKARKPGFVITSVLTKRTYADAFGMRHDDARYGQHITPNFFTTNCGHTVNYPPKNTN